MIENIKLENFKSIKKAKIKIRPITIFIGPNGSGKSNFIQALMLLKQSRAHNDLILDGDHGKFISIHDISFFRDINTSIGIQLSGNIKCNVFENDREVESSEFAYSIENRFKREILALQRIKLDFNSIKIHLESNQLSRFKYLDWTFTTRSLEKIGGRLDVRIEKPHPEVQPREYQRIEKFMNCLKSIEKEISKIYFIPAVRGIISPFTSLSGNPVTEFVSSIPFSEQHQILFSTLVYEPEIAENISNWTKLVSGVPIESKVVPGPLVTINSTGPISVNIIHEGSGLNQLILLLAQLYIVPKGSLLAIEEPEIHLHPKAQTELVKILYQNVIKKKLKMLINTHSEHILFSLLTKVAQGELKNSDIAIYYFERTEQGSKITALDVSPQGTIKGGLPGFFEANISAYQAYIEAITQNLESKSE